MNKIIASAFALSLVACGSRPSNHFHVIISSEFSADEQIVINDALDSWEIALHGELTLERSVGSECDHFQNDMVNDPRQQLAKGVMYSDYVPREEHTVCIIKDSGANVDMHCGGARTACTHRDYSNDSSVEHIDMSRVNNPLVLQQVVAHETGHAWAIGHLQKGSLMYPHLIGAPVLVPTQVDIDEWHNVRR
jgi:hypothetical protein